MTPEQARRNLEGHLRTYFPKTSIEDLVPTNVRGYFQRKVPCGGLQGGCHEPIHTFLFNEGPINHTIEYLDHYKDEKGRFTSQYRTWRALKEHPEFMRKEVQKNET